MSKKYPPKNYDNIGDPTRTEGSAGSIGSAGKGGTFRKDGETFLQSQERRLTEGEARRGRGVEAIEKKMKELEQQPNSPKEVKEKTSDKDKNIEKEPKPSR